MAGHAVFVQDRLNVDGKVDRVRSRPASHCQREYRRDKATNLRA
ncbi:hypothetical protein RISK_003901 [Rhodopirellula islandica]|uniref:Uncharacterized protein n=1 Tax=Rhodopirellula islandica TaxID=595434 RepID=A0A0J1BCF3_RHOIS|nr:hypothetical protein RISK_003901 [Rhodopirellula islandica]